MENNLEKDIYKDLFIASNTYNTSDIVRLVTVENCNAVMPEEMLHEFSTRYSLLESSIKNKDDFAVDFLLSYGSRIESYIIENSVNGTTREHNPIGLAIANGNENALANMLSRRSDLLTEKHVDLFYKVAANRELTYSELRDISEVMVPVCKQNGIDFDSQAATMLYDIKVTQDDNFKSFYNQLVNAEMGPIENVNKKELNEFMAVLRDSKTGEVIYSGEFKYGRKDGMHFNVHDRNLQVSCFEMGRELKVPTDIEMFIALKNNNMRQVELLTSRATIDCLQPQNIDFFPERENGRLSLLETAIAEGKNEIAKHLIDSGSKLDKFEINDVKKGITREHDPLMVAIKNNNTEIFDYLSKKKPELVTELHMQELHKLQNKARFDQTVNKSPEYAFKELDFKLKKAIQEGNIDEAKSFILKGADVNAIEKSDLINLSEEQKSTLKEVLKSSISEKPRLDGSADLKI